MIPQGVSSSLADPHRVGPFGGWHFGSIAGLTLRGVVPSLETQQARRRANSRRGNSQGFVLRTAQLRLSHENGEASARESAEWLDGPTVIDGSSVSAFGSAPIRQREVLLAHGSLPFRANTRKNRNGERYGGSVGQGSPCLSRACLSRDRRAPEPLVIRSRRRSGARVMPSQFFLREGARARVRRG